MSADKSETPRTDEMGNQDLTINDITPPYPVLQKWGKLCGELETELAAAHEKIASLTADYVGMCGVARERDEKIARMREAHDELFERIDQWADAYPTDLWPEVSLEDWPRIDKALTAAGWSLSRIGASNMRHVITRIKELADKTRALKE